MIPEFNKYGNLPAGIYNTSIEEIGKKFGIESSQRKKLFKNLESLNKLLLKNKNVIKRFLIDGSFVTDVEFPEDIDCILIIKKNFSFTSSFAKKMENSKAIFGIDILPFTEEEPYQYKYWINYFSHTRDKKIKGLLEVNYD